MSSSVENSGGASPPESQTASPETAGPAVAEPRWEQVVEVASRADLFANHLGEPVPEYHKRNGPGLSFMGSQGGVSRRSAAARPGDVFRATTSVHAEGEGESPPVHFGPMFLDVRDNVLIYSVPVPVKEVGANQTVEVEVTAPHGTMAVRLRIVGGWAENQESPKLLYTYGVARLFKKIV